MIAITILLTALISLVLGAAPAKLARRRVRQQDLGWGLGLWLATWVFALCAYLSLIHISRVCGGWPGAAPSWL